MELKIGVMAHMFHSALFETVKRQLQNISQNTDLHLTTCSVQDAMDLKLVFADWNGAVEIHVVGNRGRDIAPKLIALRNAHERYDLVLHLHTKASDPAWREYIYDNLLGKTNISRIIEAFERSPQLGMVGGEHYPKWVPWIGWGWNGEIAVGVLRRMCINPDHIVGLDFPSGSMFWTRPAALQPLFDLNLALDDFPPEPLDEDGTLAHTIERLFYISCEAAGYHWGVVSEHGDIQIKTGLQKLYYPNPVKRFLKDYRKERRGVPTSVSIAALSYPPGSAKQV